VQKTIVLTFRSNDDALKFVELIEKALKNKNVIVLVKGCKVKIIAPSIEQEETIHKVKILYRYWKTSSTPRGDLYRHPIPLVLSLADLSISIPLNGLVSLLNLYGRKAELKNSFLVTSARLGEVVSLAERYSRAYRETTFLPLSPTLKRLVAAVATILRIDAEEALEIFRELELVFIDERGRFYLRMPESKAINALLKYIRKRKESHSDA